jgi:hypothetical protein
VGTDVGVIWLPGKSTRFGFTAENIGYAADVQGSKNPPPPIPHRFSLGMTTRMDMKSWHWDNFIDIQDLTNPNGFHTLRLVHLGTELATSYFTRDHDLGVQAGVNEGYFTLGGFLDLYVTRLAMVYYAVELGEFPGQRKDRRFGLTLQSSMTF